MSEQRLAIRAESIQLAIDTLADGDIDGTVSQLEGLLDCAPFIDEVEPDHSHHAKQRRDKP
ncbi:MAG: hypothetical protein K8963_09270 [Proteobacteria bacterium]|nr:hypothetical protein [Pseudomonadota bacterium]